MKIVFLLALLAIIIALAMAGRAMLLGGRAAPTDAPDHPNQPDTQKSHRMMRALALRVGLSVALFVFILIAYQMGWIHPTGVQLGQ